MKRLALISLGVLAVGLCVSFAGKGYVEAELDAFASKIMRDFELRQQHLDVLEATDWIACSSAESAYHALLRDSQTQIGIINARGALEMYFAQGCTKLKADVEQRSLVDAFEERRPQWSWLTERFLSSAPNHFEHGNPASSFNSKLVVIADHITLECDAVRRQQIRQAGGSWSPEVVCDKPAEAL